MSKRRERKGRQPIATSNFVQAVSEQKKKESEREREGAFYDTAVDAVGLGRAVWCQ